MYARVLSACLFGLDCEKVRVESDIENGLSSFNLVGLANRAIKESKERIRAAVLNSGYDFPDTRITVNLTPAGVQKEGSHFDLAIALSLLASSGQLEYLEKFDDMAFLGELTLNGNISPVDGVLPMVIGLRERGVKKIMLPKGNINEARLLSDMEFYPAATLNEAVDHIEGRKKIGKDRGSPEYRKKRAIAEDFSDIKGQETVKRAAQIAAAGFHGMLMIGPPGVGKSMIGKRIPGIMPEMTYEQMLEVTQIYSISGQLNEERPVIFERPFRNPHHNTTAVSLVGGGNYPRPGEVSLAHNGVLFLDELPEFSAKLLESLRQPLEDGKLTIVRASGKCTFPSRFMLVAAMNPCRCGYYGDPNRKCSCTESERLRYISKISGPLLDRIDLHIAMQRPTYVELNEGSERKIIDSASLKEGIATAVEIQKRRYVDEHLDSNSALSASMIRKYCVMTDDAESVLKTAFTKFRLSARSYHRLIKVSRTVADLGKSSAIQKEHVLEALSYRIPDDFFRG